MTDAGSSPSPCRSPTTTRRATAPLNSTSTWAAPRRPPGKPDIIYQSRCGFPHADTTDPQTHTYRKPGLILFATPIKYTLREREATWKFFVTNNGDLTATNVVVTNTVQGMDVITFTADGPDVTATLPAQTAVFTIGEIAPGEQRAVTVTGEALSCTSLTPRA